MEHIVQDHWRSWRCMFCSRELVGSEEDLKHHMGSDHSIRPDDLQRLVTLPGEGTQAVRSPIQCPLCNLLLLSTNQYQSHVGGHLEEIAFSNLSVNPQEDSALDDRGSSRFESGSEMDLDEPLVGSSLTPSVRHPMYLHLVSTQAQDLVVLGGTNP
jgi:hypothetical protein